MRNKKQTNSQPSKLATPDEYADYRQCTTNALAQERYKGIGPVFIKYGRAVRYRWSDIHAYEEANTFQRADEFAA
ncbi:DNA-binding protein [Nocardia sp. NPDC058519]|uniref:DNA-binding protein n=1 Tax=Nocardia sp. NPDC058519 TaxID=3346535 RepID=UPI00365DF0CC